MKNNLKCHKTTTMLLISIDNLIFLSFLIPFYPTFSSYRIIAVMHLKYNSKDT